MNLIKENLKNTRLQFFMTLENFVGRMRTIKNFSNKITLR